MVGAERKSLEEYLTINDAARFLGVSSWTLRNWDKTGKLKTMRHPINGYRIYKQEDLEALINTSDVGGYGHGEPAPFMDWAKVGESEHFVQFYETHEMLADSVSGFIGAALENGDGAVVIATEAHRDAIAKNLEARAINVSAAMKSGQYVCLDAAETLAQFMVDGMPDRQLFHKVIGGLVGAMSKNHQRMRAFGEMVAILWGQGNRQAAIALEELWNELAKSHPFALFCAYPLQAFAGAGQADLYQGICMCHTRVIPSESYTALSPEQRLTAISLLQQKAFSLEAEMERRKEIEKQLLCREQEMADFFENAAEGIHKVGPDGTILWANKAELALLGYTADEYISHNIAEFHADQSVIEDILQRLQRGETLHDYEASLRCKHGSIKHVVINSNVYWENGEFKYTRCFTRDITEQKQVKRVQNLLAAVVESSQDAILTKTLQGQITSWNAAAERLFGYTAQEAIGQSITMLIPPDRLSEEQHILDCLRRGERIEHYETVRVSKGGALIDISLTISPVRDGAGKIVGASKVARNISEQKRIEKELQVALEKAHSANLAKTEFLANMSHEIRTPMNAVIGLTSILGMSQPLTSKQKEYIKTLQLSADSLLSLINDLLDISKIETQGVELENVPFSLTQLTQEVISMMSVRLREKGLTFSTDAEYARHNMFLGDPGRLRQIVLNLCSNAVKFTERGGIHISVTSEPTARAGVETVCISIRDTGIGIPADRLEDVFHKFVQADTSISRKYGGTGLGLAISRTLAELMGGTVEAKSTLGEGSTFTLRLPLKVAREEQLKIAETHVVPPHEAESAHSRILLVEDYEANILVATTFLDHFGYTYDLARNGMEAVEKAKTNAYAAVLMDVQMHNMDGFDATRLIREYEKKTGKERVLIIGMTAHALAGDRERCLACGMDDYIPKPFNPEALRKKLARAGQEAMQAA